MLLTIICRYKLKYMEVIKSYNTLLQHFNWTLRQGFRL